MEYFVDYFEIAVTIVEAAAVLLLLTGISVSTARFLKAFFSDNQSDAYEIYRRGLGQTLLITLEFLIAADVLETVTIDRSLSSVGILALLVIVRTFLSFALEIELTGRWPWQGKEADKP